MIAPNLVRATSNVVLNYYFIGMYGMMGAVYSSVVTYCWYFPFIIAYLFYHLKRAKAVI